MKYLLSLRYVKLLSYICAKYLQTVRGETHQHRYVYYYGFQVIYGAINKGLLLMIFSLILAIPKETLLVTCTFIVLRIFAGGLHFNSYTKCAYVSLFSLLLMGTGAKYIHFNQIINIAIFVLTFIIFLIYAPVEHKNRLLQENEKKKFKAIAIMLLLILFIIYLYTNINSIIFGILLAGIIAIPIVNKLS